MLKVSFFATLSLLIMSNSAIAADGEFDAGTQSYAGAGVSLIAKYRSSCDLTGVECKRNAPLSGKVYIGQEMGPYALELMVFKVGAAKGTFDVGGKVVAGTVQENGAAVYGVLPYRSGDFSYKGKLGLAYTQADVRFTAGSGEKKWSAQPAVGLGVGYALSKDLAFNADWDLLRSKYPSGKTYVGMVTVGLSQRF